MKRKLVAVLMVVGLLSTMVAGCGSSDSSDSTDATTEEATEEVADATEEVVEESADPYKITVIMKSNAAEFWQTVQAGAEQAAIDFGVEVFVTATDTETDFEQQIQIIEDAATQGADAIALATLDSDAMVPTIDEVAAEGVAIVTFNSELNSDSVYAHVATDNYAAGEIAGEALAQACGGTGQYAIIGAFEGVQNNKDRAVGAADYIEANYPDMELISIQYANGDLSTAISLANDLMTAYPDIAAIYSNNETCTIGVATAIEERGKEGEVINIGFDSADQTIAYIESGTTQALVTQVPYQMGYLAVQYAIDAIEDVAIDETVIDTGSALITTDNLYDDDIQAIVNPLD